MKIGVTFGGYCPLHQGHLDVIMRAKKENDHCYVIVCGYDNDRGGDYLPLKKRYRLIKEFLSSENVTVLMIDDTQLGLDESMSQQNWRIWLHKAYELMKVGLEDNITWYVSEERYVLDIANNSPFCLDVNVELMDRTLNPISGTMCRENPLKYWDKITAPFRPYYSHNILVTGTASEGKTTLVQDIGKYFNDCTLNSTDSKKISYGIKPRLQRLEYNVFGGFLLKRLPSTWLRLVVRKPCQAIIISSSKISTKSSE